MPRVLWLTREALALAQVPLIRNFLLLLFLASNGARSVVARIVEVGPGVFYYAAGTVAIDGVLIVGIGFALRMRADVLAIASQANVGGAPRLWPGRVAAADGPGAAQCSDGDNRQMPSATTPALAAPARFGRSSAEWGAWRSRN